MRPRLEHAKRFSRLARLSVQDNVLILHDVDMRTSMMYDVKLSTEYPVVPPFPLQHAGAGEEGELYARSWSFAQPCVTISAALCSVGRVVLCLLFWN